MDRRTASAEYAGAQHRVEPDDGLVLPLHGNLLRGDGRVALRGVVPEESRDDRPLHDERLLQYDVVFQIDIGRRGGRDHRVGPARSSA